VTSIGDRKRCIGTGPPAPLRTHDLNHESVQNEQPLSGKYSEWTVCGRNALRVDSMWQERTQNERISSDLYCDSLPPQASVMDGENLSRLVIVMYSHVRQGGHCVKIGVPRGEGLTSACNAARGTAVHTMLGKQSSMRLKYTLRHY
jgi:hypothetical protein